MALRAPRPTFFPYTTLFRSRGEALGALVVESHDRQSEDALPTLASQLGVGIRRSLFEARLQEYASELESRAEERSEEHTSELQSPVHIVCRHLLVKNLHVLV